MKTTSYKRCLKLFIGLIILACLLLLINYFKQGVYNNPYSPSERVANILYSSFDEQPKTLDPVKSYSSNEYQFIRQIYEPPLQYHYLKRPYKLIPLAAQSMPEIKFFDKNHHEITARDSQKIAYTTYTIKINPHVFFQPHPALAKNKQGKLYYQNINQDYLEEHDIKKLSDFKHLGTRELTAKDYVFQIQRLLNPKSSSPIYSLMKDYIIDVKLIDKYSYQIKIKGLYPQFIYWLAMPFFAPMPEEAVDFYNKEGMKAHNITLDWYPVGSGPYMIIKNNPNRVIELVKNPNFHDEFYPTEGEETDKANHLLDYSGEKLPFIDKVIFSLEKESIPRWNKFLQGYYDNSGISSDSFQQAINVSQAGALGLSDEMKAKGIYLQTSITPTIFYLGFNMRDDVVGGFGERAKKLRQAISIAIDYDEYISIFLNDRALSAQSIIPPGIFGGKITRDNYNQSVYNWVDGEARKKSLDDAKQLLVEAGYPNGINQKTHQPLMINFDVTGGAGPDEKANFDWMRKQFKKIGIQLHIRATQYNRFQDKIRTGGAQLFMYGWHADYPDPENFLFLLYGPNSRVEFGGENAANYQNKEYDKLFEQMKNMPNNGARLQIIYKMIKIIQDDSPWVWGFFPKDYVLNHSWRLPAKLSEIGNNTLKYQKINPILRQDLRNKWNHPIIWPVFLFLIVLIFLMGVVYYFIKNKIYTPPKKLE